MTIPEAEAGEADRVGRGDVGRGWNRAVLAGKCGDELLGEGRGGRCERVDETYPIMINISSPTGKDLDPILGKVTKLCDSPVCYRMLLLLPRMQMRSRCLECDADCSA